MQVSPNGFSEDLSTIDENESDKQVDEELAALRKASKGNIKLVYSCCICLFLSVSGFKLLLQRGESEKLKLKLTNKHLIPLIKSLHVGFFERKIFQIVTVLKI